MITNFFLFKPQSRKSATAQNFILGLLFLVSTASFGQLRVVHPDTAGISLANNTIVTARWSKGGTTFNRVKIKLSVDGGVTFPYLLVNNTPSTATDTSEAITIPGIITTQARIRITNQADSTIGDMSDNNFTITGYCWPWSMSCTNSYISSFAVNSLLSTSTCTFRGYSNSAASGAKTTTLYKNNSFPFTLKTSKINPNMSAAIWCDFNNDKDFDDAGEFLYTSSLLDTTHIGSIFIPSTVTSGQRRLRIRTVQGNLLGASDFCTFYNVGGEIEDYTVTIAALTGTGPLIVRTPSASGISVPTGNYTVKWSKGGTTFDKVQIKLSVDGGVSYPYLLVNNTPSTTDTTEVVYLPGLITTQARIRVANQRDSTINDVSDNNFTIRGYCFPANTVCTNNYIRSVAVNTLSNTANTCSTRGYVNNTASGLNTTTLYTGVVYPFTIKTSKTTNMGLGIWCDLNGDLDFDDAGEHLYSSPITDTSFAGSISIPNGTTLANKRLRVRAVSGVLLSSTDYCTYFSAGGEIEDYTISVDNIIGAGPLVVRVPSNSGISLVSGTTSNAKWSKGGTTYPNVKIKFSEDGGLTFPYLLVNNTPSTSTDTTENFVVPGIITSQGRIQITNQADSTIGDISDNDFAITGYCWPPNTSCTNNYIRNVAINTLSNTSTCATGAYVNVAATGANTTSLNIGQSYSFTVKTSKTNTNMGIGIYCDLNSNFDFGDPGELLFSSAILDTTFTGSITIPNGTSIGSKRFRVRTLNGSIPGASDYCTFFTVGGEIEDYTVSVVNTGPGPLIVRAPDALGITLTTTGTATSAALWSKGSTSYNTVKIKMSADGGATYPYLLVNNTPSLASDTTENFVIPGIITNQARIRITNQADSTVGDFSDNNFTIAGYCWPYGTSCSVNYLEQVVFNTLNNSSTCNSTRAYVNNAKSGARTTTVQIGLTYPFKVRSNKTNTNMGFGIWADWNSDTDFDDAGEFLYSSPILDTTFSGTITIPSVIATGDVRFRVRTVRGTLLGAGDYCTFFNAGSEMEDYTITVSKPTIRPASLPVSFCAGTSFNVPFTTTGTFLAGNSYTAQLSLPGGSFTSATNIGTGTVSPIVVNIPLGTVAGTYLIRIVSTNPPVFGYSSNSLTVKAKPASPVTTSATRCGPGSVTMSATGCVQTRWYTVPSGGTSVNSGPTYITPSLSQFTNYYVSCRDLSACESFRSVASANVKPLPVISGISPVTGIIDEAIVTVSGSGLVAIDSARFSTSKRAFVYNQLGTSFETKAPVGSSVGPITVYTSCGSSTSTQSFTPIIPTIANPTISQPAGTYPSAISVTLSTTTPGADVYYTLNGNTPVVGTSYTTKYTGPVFVGTDVTLSAIGYRNGWTTSGVSSASYVITTKTSAAKPVISPLGGTFTGAQLITITCATSGAKIYFTLTGNTPVPGAGTTLLYQGPFTLTQAFVNVKAIGVKEGYVNSQVQSQFYTISGAVSLTACSFSPLPGIYPTAQNVTISNIEAGASIYYTLDGTEPTQYNALAILYSGPVAITTSKTLKARAYKIGFGESPQTIGNYTIGALRKALDGSQSDYYTDATPYYGEAGTKNEFLEYLNRNSDLTVKIYPNPGTGVFFMDYGKDVEGADIQVLNMLGQEVLRVQSEESTLGTVLNLSSQRAGFYIVRLKDRQGNLVEKKIAIQ